MTLDLLMHRQIVKIVLNIVAISFCNSVVGCNEKGGSMSQRPIEQVQKEHTPLWMAIPGVEGTAIGLFEDKLFIKIFSSRKAEELRAKIPSTIDGYPVIIEETGIFRALNEQ